MTEGEVYRKYANDLVRYATGLVGPFDAADVVSDACLRAFGTPGWVAVTNPRAYLYRAVLSAAMDHHRSTASRRLREARSAQPSVQEAVEVDVDVLRAIGRLSVRQRAAVVLFYWEDLAVDDVAHHMGVSPGAVKRHLFRARSRLKEWLQ